jgi:hypothetical protein
MFSRHVLQVCLSGCCTYLHVFYLDVVYGCNGFQVFLSVFSSVSQACFKCLNCLQRYVATGVFECFKSRSSVAYLLPTFSCIVSPGAGRHPYEAVAGSFCIGGATCPSPLATQGGAGPA